MLSAFVLPYMCRDYGCKLGVKDLIKFLYSTVVIVNEVGEAKDVAKQAVRQLRNIDMPPWVHA